MDDKKENPKDKYTKMFQKLRKDKTESNLNEIYSDLKENKSNLLDDSKIPFQFSNDLIWLLINNIINLKLQSDIFKLYIDSFLSTKIKPENLQKITILEQIFKYDCFLYKTTADTEDFKCFIKKYFDKYFPRKKNIKFERGEVMDVFISDKDLIGHDLYGWTQLPIKRIENNYVIFDDYDDDKGVKELKFLMDSYEVQPRNTFISEEEMKWRNELRRGQKVDFLNNKRLWVEANVLNVLSNNAVIAVLGGIQGDNSIKSIYSPLIKPLSRYSFNYDENEKNYFPFLEHNSLYSLFNYCLPIPKISENEDTNYLIPYPYLSYHCLFFYDIFNYFINKVISSKIFDISNEQNLNVEYIYKILDTLNRGFEILNQLFIGKYFKDKIFPRLKNILLNISVDKKKNISKIIIDKILNISEKFIGLNCYSFQKPKTTFEFILKFGFNCFKENENLEKRLIGLNSILLGLKSLDFFTSNHIQNDYNLIIYQNFLTDDNNDLFELLFNKSDLHEQLILKGTEIAIYLFKQNLLDSKDINKLYNFALSSQEGSLVCTQLYHILTEISKNISLTQSQNMINKIITFPIEQIRGDDINLIFSIIQNIKKENDYMKILNNAFDYVYKFIINDISKGKNFISDFTRTIASLKHDDHSFFASYYIEKIINELLLEKDWKKIEFFYDFLSYFIMSFSTDAIKNEMKKKIVEILNKNNNSKKLLENLTNIIDDNKIEITLENKIDHISFVIDSLKSILSFSQYKNFFTNDFIMKLCDIFIFAKKKPPKMGEFINSINFLKYNYLMNLEEFCKTFFEKLDKYLSEINKDNYKNYYDIIDEDYADMVLKFYQEINNLEEYSHIDNDYISENCFVKKNPLELKYFDIVWKMFTKINQFPLMEEFLSNFSLRLFTQEERHEIWETVIKKIFDEQNFVDLKIALNMIKNIVTISEKFGTGNVISHSLEKIKKFPLKISFKSQFDTIKDFEITENIYTTSTIYELKKEIQKKIGIDPIFIEFSKFNVNNIDSNSNGKNLCFIFNLQNTSTSSLTSLTKEQLEKKYSLTIKKSRYFLNMKKLKLIDENNPHLFNEKTKSIFLQIFKEASNNTDKLNNNLFKELYQKASGMDQNINHSQVQEIFNRFDNGHKNYWNFDDFIEFYMDSYKKKNIIIIYMNLNNLGYRNDLEVINKPLDEGSPLYYEENNVTEYMPRYFIGNNMEYMNKLFSFSSSNDKSVHELAQKIIKELSTMSQMKNLFLDKNKEKIDELFNNNNIEMRTYILNIILSDLENNNENDDKDIQSSINMFIERNLDKIITNLNNSINSLKEDINNKKNNNEDSTQFIQFIGYYHVLIQIIIFCLKKVIDDKNFFELIQKFDDDKEEKDNNTLSAISKKILNKTNINSLKNLNLKELFNIALTFLLLQKEQVKTVTYDLKFSYIIILVVFMLLEINLDNYSKVKDIIYNDYIKNLVNLSKSPLVKCKKLLQYANQFVLNLKKTDEKFCSSVKEEVSKEIMKYEILNWPTLSKNIIFTIFKDVLKILFKKDEISKDDNSLFNIFKSIIDLVNNNKIELREFLLTNYLEILSLIIAKLKEIDNKSLLEYDFNDFITLLINKFLITTKNNLNNNYPKYNDREYISTLFELINTIISLDPNKYLFTFFNNEDIKNLKSKHLSNLPDQTLNYDPKIGSKSYNNYLGLKNLSSLCYMNSVLQQLYMIPIFQKSLMNLKIKDIDYKSKETEDLDELLFQLIKMFYYLTYSDKKYYNPKSFVHSFKDYEGNPTNPNVQCDAQEFLTRFIEKIEEQIKNSNERFLCNNILGGTTLQQITCTNNDCNNISERKESIIYLSLDIKGNKTIYECLEKYTSEEKIEDYHCEKCGKKITHKKRVVIDKLPNILILHLQRISFNYETFLMEKINDEVAFEKELNVKKYTIDKSNKNIDNDQFDYELIGVIIHNGTAQYGHYYSVIYSQDKKSDKNKWYKFNDTSVTETTYESMKRDIESNSSSNDRGGEYNPSPYMLLYRKKIKYPVLMNIRDIDEKDNIVKLLKDDKKNNINHNGVNYELYKNEKEAIEKNKSHEKNDKEIILKDNKLIAHLISYDEALNYNSKINENRKEEEIPFKSMIIDENIKFYNDKKMFSFSFLHFINKISKEIKNMIEKDNTLSENYLPLCKTINDYLFNIFSISYHKEELKLIIDNINSILKYMPKMVTYLVKEIIEPKKEILLYDYLLCKDAKLGEAFSNYIAKTLILSIDNNVENEASLQLIKFYTDKIPVDISKKWSEMEHFNNFILILTENSDKIKKEFIIQGMISKLIDFILGKESPIYKGDERKDNKNIKGKLGPLVRSIAYLYQYYLNNKDKDKTLKLSEDDEKLIGHMPFYEKIILDDYDDKGILMLINFKIDSSFNINEPLNKDNLDLITKLKIPSSKNKDSIISSLSLIENILSKVKEDNDKKKLLNIIIGVPSLVVESGEAKIIYVCGSYYNYYSILNFIALKKTIDEETVPILTKIFEMLCNHQDVYEYINKLPAPNSYSYSYLNYLLKLYIETVDKQKNNSDNIKFDMQLFEKLNNIVSDLCKKYNINLDSIRNDNNICIRNYMFINEIEYIVISELKNINNEIRNSFKEYEKDIKIFYYKLSYNLTQDKNINTASLLTEKKEINFIKGSDSNKSLEKNNLNSYYIEGIVIYANTDCDLTFSFEPYLYSDLEIHFKKYERCILFLKQSDTPYNENKIEIDLTKLKIGKNEKGKPNDITEFDATKVQANEDALVITCQMCGTSNVIDENNQTFQCIFCSGALL